MSYFIYRKHKGSLEESMKSKRTFVSLYGLLNYVSINNKCDIKDVTISLYDTNIDTRINWNYTCVICCKNEIVGFCTYKINKKE